MQVIWNREGNIITEYEIRNSKFESLAAAQNPSSDRLIF